MFSDISMFDGSTPYRITKPVRLIELFAGIGAQAKALENLNIPFEHYRICEFDKFAVQSYNAVHGTNFKTSDITKIKAADLGIVETDKYEYIMTYSFPCTDLSIDGKQAGMTKGSGTRSGLLWEVERLLNGCKELPQILLMENVPQVLNSDFGAWLDFLEELGYHNYYEVLNAKDYGIPQNRDRCFMVSLLGDYYYDFPKPIPLKLRLKNMLESKVDEKYYLSVKAVGGLKRAEKREHGPTYLDNSTGTAKCVTTEVGNLGHFEQYVKEPRCEVIATLNIPGRFESACRVHGIDGIAPTCNTCGGGGHETKILEPLAYNEQNKILRVDGTVGTLTTDGSSPKHNNRVIEPLLVGGIGDINFGSQYRQGNRVYDSEEIACALNASPVGNAGGESYLYKVAEPTILTPKRTEYGKAIRKDYEAGLHKESRHNFTQLEPKQEPTSNTITTVQKDNMLIEPRIFDMYNQNEIKTGICGTITANGNTSSTHCGTFGIAENYRIRKLTPKECWRLMGFDDSDFYKAKAAGVSDSQLYKQAGNSIVVPVLEAIFKQII